MKKILLLSMLSLSFLFSGSLTSSEITSMVEKIKKERAGISLAKLEDTANPFIIRKKKKKEIKAEIKKKKIAIVIPEIVYHVKAILNRAAFINKKWYKAGDKLGKYKVEYVAKDSVTLRSKSGTKVIKLENKKKNFIKLNQGYK